MIVLGIHAPGEAKLTVTGHAMKILGFEFSFVEGGQKKAGKDGYDSDDNKQFNKGECGAPEKVPTDCGSRLGIEVEHVCGDYKRFGIGFK
jgi:hypothetical protein